MTKGDWLGEFELCVLLAIDRLGPDAYGLRIRQHLDETIGRTVAVGAMYSTLARLKDKGLVVSRTDDPRPVQGGRARNVFRLTDDGTRALTTSTTMLKRMMAGWKPRTAR